MYLHGWGQALHKRALYSNGVFFGREIYSYLIPLFPFIRSDSLYQACFNCRFCEWTSWLKGLNAGIWNKLVVFSGIQVLETVSKIKKGVFRLIRDKP
jgi:hypothetical protein